MSVMTTSRRTHALFGAVSALVGLAVGHLAATLIAPASSPVLVVGSTLIDLAPRPVKMAVIEWFGTADKPLLIGLVTVGTLAIAAIAGVVSRRRPAVGVGVLFGLGLVVAVLTATSAKFGSFGFIPALIAGTLGAALLGVLPQWAHGAPATDAEADPRGSQRRTLLGSAGLLSLAAIVFGASGAVRRDTAPAVRIALPKPATPLPPLPRGLSGERFLDRCDQRVNSAVRRVPARFRAASMSSRPRVRVSALAPVAQDERLQGRVQG